MPSLKAYNTFGVDASAPKIHFIQSRKDLENFDFKSKDDFFILGGGSNLLLTKDLAIPVLKNEIKGIRIVQQSVGESWVQIGGGENWHETVLWTLENKLSGLENLSLIPGTVGASPIQNIGAYGVELKDVFYQLTAYDLIDKELKTFNKEDCDFGYRSSFFKQDVNKGRYFISHVTLKLSKNFEQVNTSYGAIKEVLEEKGVGAPNAKDVSTAVIEIRQSKLPDPKEIGNSGSFFKNPVVKWEILEGFQGNYEKVPHYKISEALVKIPAGWLIEQCGFKGVKYGETGSYAKQALIIVNYGNATGAEILAHSERVQNEVNKVFGISLECEVNIL